MSSLFLAAYNRFILGHPIITLFVTVLFVVALGSHAHKFRLDASADTLILENDASLKYYRSIKAIYGTDDSLVITYTPEGDLFSDEALEDLRQFRSKLSKVDRVATVTSILDVPLINSPPVTLFELSEGIITLESPEADRVLAKKEFLTSPLYRDLLVSADGQSTALQVTFEADEKRDSLLKKRNILRARQLETELSMEERQSLQEVSDEYDSYNAVLQVQLDNTVKAVRKIMDEHRHSASLFLGGVPMIVSDSIDFVRHDLLVFGLSVLAILVVILTLIFRRPRWVILSMLTCAVSGFSMIGMLGLLRWPITVVSSNFVLLLLILTLSLLVHLIVRYRELLAEKLESSQRELILETVKSKFVPCLYTSITTMVAFGSLVVSGIRPVIDFGWIMVIGISIAQVITFTLFPATLVLLGKEKPVDEHDFTESITQFLARKNEQYGGRIISFFIVFALLSVWGFTKLTVENRFIDYYKDSTEIYQGMELIDRKFGGTTPLDVVIDAPASFFVEESGAEDEDGDFFDDEFEDEFGDEGAGAGAGLTATSYWFNSQKLDDILAIHDYIDDLRESGKVISLATTIRMLGSLNEDVLTNDFELAILYKKLPPVIKNALIRPYMSEDGNQLRFSIRVFESDPTLKRSELLTKIKNGLIQELGLEAEQVNVTGMVVLYNNMLQSLFTSQILTLGVVFVAIMLMLAGLFRNIRLATIAIVPNMIAAGMVLGIMGWLKIPLDMMTITIAAICIGIAVDNSIHYVHRFKSEYAISQDYWVAARRSHQTIGRAMYYTSMTITLGFSVLAFSNFIPTIYFGLLTGFSMVAALLANMTLLPLLIIRFKPLDVLGNVR
ncbi:MAG: transporter [Cycloclasticus sp. symbiont of Poecilosclerida sp. M]|nr:MAG: transporter [Cycloclasticus sp. symbiont of Poecilosclerida sp. M]